ncbi:MULTISPECIES: hypothetical protein [unclassified Polaromonas]|jgi:hypothetical protein|uniref:hypothetical protein n=1 Tax=unclassified Polaromonas TaxID=2638319 RepID=UPI000BCC3DA5|nr:MULTISPECIES: hypothetical protein [unclassified Polaromonas]OYY32703.1 MAG: hypothetical protein B7Y60_21595 [Polaromonas sp. 35-63-35]OYZ16144.1 MAG: hypothetical protein B7Y28_21385 [Polaromonas sp. 16-63-31]OYZ75999.1 MAG: hypothetical protein B7Y09_22370 [Polaromonas sp. 24-63-21]OZA52978.1 MAG: hypothetical protein B7X88_03510 [Polaromonas sp. 17-63-33]OZA85438.1 MAG: hypothetical protein B7X65_21520 [Polaromonas sp. 39-63-25]
MNRHAFYPGVVIPTVPSRRKRLLRFLRWLALFMAVALMVLGAATAIAMLVSIDAQLDSAFMQGMKAGQQMCARGA